MKLISAPRILGASTSFKVALEEVESGHWQFQASQFSDKEENLELGLEWEINQWDTSVYLSIPGVVYGANRFHAIPQPYPPMPTENGKLLQVGDIPRLSLTERRSAISLPSAACATPGVGLFFPSLDQGVWFVWPENASGFATSFEIAEDLDAQKAWIRVKIGVCDSHSSKAQSIFMNVVVKTFSCNSPGDLFSSLTPWRKLFQSEVRHQPIRPFSSAMEILESKYNQENWMEELGYYAVGTEPVRRTHISQNWQMGWTGGMISAYALLLNSDTLSRQRALRNFDFVFPSGQAPSGFFYGMGDGKEWHGDHFKDPNAPWHLVRKSADGLFYMLSSLIFLRQSGHEDLINPTWVEGILKCALAFVKLWDETGDWGQFVNHDTGELIVPMTCSAGMAPGALILAARFFPEHREVFLRVATAGMKHFETEYVRRGLTCGGPGDAMQCPDSESAAAVLESFLLLYEETADSAWLDSAHQAAALLSSWVVSYHFDFPVDSTFGELEIESLGTVMANSQNRHSAPGLCTCSGLALLKLYRASGVESCMDLLEDIARSLPQFLSTKERPIRYRIPYGKADDPSQDSLNPGWMNERVNLTQWGPDEMVGEVFYCSCWPEVSLMLTAMELPGIVVRIDTGRIWALDHLLVNWKLGSRTILEIKNPTAFPACTTILAEDAQMAKETLPIGFASRLPQVTVPPHGCVSIEITAAIQQNV